MRRLLFLTTMLAAVFLLTNCNNYRRLTAQSQVLFKDKWRLTEVQGQTIPDSVRSSFEFTPGRFSGSAGCNPLSSGFAPGKHQKVRFTPDSLGAKDCGNEQVALLELSFMEALLRSTKWDIEGGQLWLGDGKATLIKFKKDLP